VKGEEMAVAEVDTARRVKLAVAAGVVLLLAGALALIAVRGPAILIDLAAGAGQMFCF
jgi:hypothetical protein